MRKDLLFGPTTIHLQKLLGVLASYSLDVGVELLEPFLDRFLRIVCTLRQTCLDSFVLGRWVKFDVVNLARDRIGAASDYPEIDRCTQLEALVEIQNRQL